MRLKKRGPQVALTIAGFDPSSGAGVTADLQVFAAHGLFGTACITALTVQSTRGVVSSSPVVEGITPTLQELDNDLPPAGVKIGVLGTAEAVDAVAAYVQWLPKDVPVVLDPVMVSSSGAPLLAEDAVATLRRELLPLVGWITPNRAELGVLTGRRVGKAAEVEAAMRELQREFPKLKVVATDGGAEPPVDRLLVPGSVVEEFAGEHVETSSTHGTGCAFSSGLLARLVLGDAPGEAVRAAKAYVAEALRRAPGVGTGHGPLDLLWPLRR